MLNEVTPEDLEFFSRNYARKVVRTNDNNNQALIQYKATSIKHQYVFIKQDLLSFNLYGSSAEATINIATAPGVLLNNVTLCFEPGCEASDKLGQMMNSLSASAPIRDNFEDVFVDQITIDINRRE